jgi:hypothetical protein
VIVPRVRVEVETLCILKSSAFLGESRELYQLSFEGIEHRSRTVASHRTRGGRDVSPFKAREIQRPGVVEENGSLLARPYDQLISDRVINRIVTEPRIRPGSDSAELCPTPCSKVKTPCVIQQTSLARAAENHYAFGG